MKEIKDVGGREWHEELKKTLQILLELIESLLRKDKRATIEAIHVMDEKTMIQGRMNNNMGFGIKITRNVEVSVWRVRLG